MRQALVGGAYQARSVVASCQRSVNLFSEPLPEQQGEPAKAADYPTPGTRLLSTIGAGPIRGIRQATTGAAYVVSGDTVYKVDPTSWAGTSLGTLTPGLTTPVSMADNGLDMVIVDGSANGWKITLVGDVFGPIPNPDGTFYGADRVDYLDTYLLFNKPRTPQFYSSDSLALTFDPLWFANKQSYSDLLVTQIVSKRDILLIGEKTTEVWTDVGKPDFPFEQQPGVFIDHGISAKYSVSEYDNGAFWLTADRQGQGIVVMVAGYQSKRISTYAIENEISGYARISDAIGFCYQLGGHTFYVLTFPSSDKTWVYDITTGMWHEWVWIDTNGEEHRHRANCYWPVNGTPVVGDWQNGNLYALDSRVFTDNGRPIKRARSFPHIVNEGKRVFYRQFLADFDTGNAPQEAISGGAGRDYNVTLVNFIAPGVGGISISEFPTYAGFPTAPFNYLVTSFWVCLPADSAYSSNFVVQWPFFSINPVSRANTLDIILKHSTTSFFSGHYGVPFSNLRSHVLVSVDCVAQVVQVYVNDAPVSLVSGGFTAASNFLISGDFFFGIDASGSVGGGPAIADVWSSDRPSFVDLSVEANRRKFVNSDLSPVDLGATGTTPFGTTPPVFMTVPTGGVPTDFQTNYGTGAPFSTIFSDLTLMFQAGGVCTLPIPPPGPPPAPPPLTSNLISLSWSDNAGHSYGNPVSQDIGAAGEYRTSLQWQRLGLARSRVFEISWSVPMPTALQGCWVDVTPGSS